MLSFGSFPPSWQSPTWDHFPQLVEVYAKSLIVWSSETRRRTIMPSNKVKHGSYLRLTTLEYKIKHHHMTLLCVSYAHIILRFLSRLSNQGNHVSTSSLHQMHSNYLSHSKPAHSVHMFPLKSRHDVTKVTGWSTDYLCGYQHRNRWLSSITWTCCCDYIGIIITLCTLGINWKHFTINHINTYEDVDTQYHLTLQLFFSNYIPLKVEVTCTASIKRPLPPNSWNNTPDATS